MSEAVCPKETIQPQETGLDNYFQHLVIHLFCHKNLFLSPPFLHRTENQMCSHPDYRAYSLLLAP